jgi:hypothetical protein
MKTTIVFFSSIVILSILFIGCKDDENNFIGSYIDILSTEYDNIPVIVNTQDSFTFTVSAKNLNYNLDDNLSFTSDSLVVTITSSQSSSTNSSFSIWDYSEAQIFSESLNTNKVVVKDNFGGKIPHRVKIDLGNYSGKLTIVIANKNAGN